ncbi:MAG: sensor domain-containing diguanylate cyclase [Calditrichaceae bacterium]|nr:sensor domain-containing diguanylate cyclase [Calditrichaceae bacterium]
MSDTNSFVECARGVLPILDEVVSLHSPERIMHNIVEQLVKNIHCKTCAIVQINQTTDILEISNFHNLSWKFCKDYRKQIISPVMRNLIWQNEPIHIPNYAKATHLAEELKMENDFVSCIAVQLSANQQPLGFLYLDSDKANHFSEKMQYLIQMYARIISMCIFNERMTEKLKRLQLEDSESGAMRYEQFYPRMQELFHRSHRLHESLSVILIDIAHYGGIIQTYGLDVAKELLQQFVVLMKNNLRPYDPITRFGADKFLIVLQATNCDIAYKVTQRINLLFKTAEFTEQKLKLAVTIGVANYPENCVTLNGLINAAKHALLESKRHQEKGGIAMSEGKFD